MYVLLSVKLLEKSHSLFDLWIHYIHMMLKIIYYIYILHIYIYIYFFFGEGDGTPLQYSCLENPMDGGAWWAAVHGVAKSRT